MKAVTLFVASNLKQIGHIAVGNEISHIHLFLASKLIAVLYNHQLVSFNQILFFILDLCTDTGIVAIRHFVGAAQDYGLPFSVIAIRIGQGFQQVSAGQSFNVREAFNLQAKARCRHGLHVVRKEQLTQMSGIFKDAGFRLLANHCSHRTKIHPAKRAHGFIQRRALIHANRRQLGTVAHQQQLALCTASHKSYQVRQQITGTEGGTPALLHAADQGCLVNDEQRPGRLVMRY